MKQIQPGQYITIIDRKCSDKVQPNVKIGDIYIVDEISQTSKGIPVLISHSIEDNKKVVRCNQQRFRWVTVDFYNRAEIVPFTGRLKEGHMIIITARYVAPNVQREIQVNNVYKVKRVKRFTDGHTEITVNSLNRSDLTYKLTSLRFRWERLVVGELMKSAEKTDKMKQAIGKMYEIANETQFEKTKDKLLQDFSFEEQSKISQIPLIIYNIAWMYANKVTEYAAEHHIDEVKKLSRAVKMLREKYIEYLSQDLDLVHRTYISSFVERFMSDHQVLFTQFYFTVLNTINHQHIGIAYDALRAYAYIAKLFLGFLWNFEDQMTELIRERLGVADNVHLPHQEALKDCMEAYLGDYHIQLTQEIEIALRVFVKDINNIEFTENHE